MNKTRYLTQAAIIAALYAVLTHMQNLLLPGTTTWAIQMRISEADQAIEVMKQQKAEMEAAEAAEKAKEE